MQSVIKRPLFTSTTRTTLAANTCSLRFQDDWENLCHDLRVPTTTDPRTVWQLFAGSADTAGLDGKVAGLLPHVTYLARATNPNPALSLGCVEAMVQLGCKLENL